MTVAQRDEARAKRQAGATYSDIMRQYGIAKSTAWRWFKEAGLVDGQSQRYTERRLFAQRKAAETVHRSRLERTQAIISAASQEIGELTTRDLRLVGAALYWAEGAKQKESRKQVSAHVAFSNTDPRMLRLFIRFLEECCGIAPPTLSFRIYLHESASGENARTYWSSQLKITALQMAPITWKRHKPTISRVSNVGATYHGLVRIVVPKSTNLNRRISGWIEGLERCWGVV